MERKAWREMANKDEKELNEAVATEEEIQQKVSIEEPVEKEVPVAEEDAMTEPEGDGKALESMRLVRAKERRIKLLVAKAQDEKARQRRRRSNIREGRKKLDEKKKETSLLRKYAGVSYERPEVRAQKAIAGFFDLVNLCNDGDNKDFCEAYNFIGDTDWLAKTVMTHTKLGLQGKYINIDRAKLREEVLAKYKEVEKKIVDAETLLNSMLDEEEQALE